MSPALRRRISALRRRMALSLRLSRAAINGIDLPSRCSAKSSASSSSVQGRQIRRRGMVGFSWRTLRRGDAGQSSAGSF
jgi:hypothetical protein